MALDIRPLSDALGAAVTGIDIRRPLDPHDAVAVRDAFLEHHLLCFRAAPVTALEFCAFARNFGEPQLQLLRDKRHAAAPEVSVLDSTYHSHADKPDDPRMRRLSGWHTVPEGVEAAVPQRRVAEYVTISPLLINCPDVSEPCERQIGLIGRNVATRAIRHREDIFHREYLIHGDVTGEVPAKGNHHLTWSSMLILFFVFLGPADLDELVVLFFG